jgi:Zn-finger nucleic acid-binding protein
MQCPVCEDEKLSISSREGVEIDYCPQCRGVWLDRGELDKILDRAAAPTSGVASPARDRHDDPRRDDRDRYRDDDRRPYDKRRKRRSFLDEIFDFD